MAHRLLGPEAQEEFKELAMNGTTPEDLSDKFKISMTSVYNYKRLLKQQGLEIPNVHGKRPSGRYAADYVDPAGESAPATDAAEPQYTTMYLRHKGVDFTVVVDARIKVYMEEPGQILVTLS